jgi:hypothetical protein
VAFLCVGWKDAVAAAANLTWLCMGGKFHAAQTALRFLQLTLQPKFNFRDVID